MTDEEEILYVAEVEESRVSSVISRKGYLNFYDEKTKGWLKRYVLVRRPYIFIYSSERDTIERHLINLSTTEILFSEESQALLKVKTYFLITLRTNTKPCIRKPKTGFVPNNSLSTFVTGFRISSGCNYFYFNFWL